MKYACRKLLGDLGKFFLKIHMNPTKSIRKKKKMVVMIFTMVFVSKLDPPRWQPSGHDIAQLNHDHIVMGHIVMGVEYKTRLCTVLGVHMYPRWSKPIFTTASLATNNAVLGR